MNLNQFIKSYAEEVNGNFSEYDEQRSVVVVPVDENRNQAVVGEIDDNKMVTISSKVCVVDENVKYKDLLGLLQENHDTTYGKFTITNDFLKVESKVHSEEVSEATLKETIQEIAKLADKWELNITGKDIF